MSEMIPMANDVLSVAYRVDAISGVEFQRLFPVSRKQIFNNLLPRIN